MKRMKAALAYARYGAVFRFLSQERSVFPVPSGLIFGGYPPA